MSVSHLHQQRPVRLLHALDDGRVVDTLVIGHGSRDAVFLHGITANHRLYYQLLRRLADELDLTIYAGCLANHGKSSDTMDYDRSLDLVIDWADSMQLRRALWLGHSLGGYFCYAVAIARPDLASHVVALAAPVSGPFNDSDVWSAGSRLGALTWDALMVQSLAGAAALWQGRWPDYWQGMWELASGLPRLRNVYATLFGAPDLNADLARLRGVQVDSVFGALDMAVTAPASPLPGRTHVIPGALHNFPLATWSKALGQITQITASAIGVAPRSSTLATVTPLRMPAAATA